MNYNHRRRYSASGFIRQERSKGIYAWSVRNFGARDFAVGDVRSGSVKRVASAVGEGSNCRCRDSPAIWASGVS